MGCYTDDESNRAMSIQTNNPTDNTVDKCVDFCRQNQFTFAGLEVSIFTVSWLFTASQHNSVDVLNQHK